MQDNTYDGLGWYTLGQLFEPSQGAHIKNYADLITEYNMLTPKPPTGAGIEPVASGVEWYEPKIYDNIVLASNNVGAYDLISEYGAPLCTIASYDGGNNPIRAYTGDNYIVVAGGVQIDNRARWGSHVHTTGLSGVAPASLCRRTCSRNTT